MLKEGRVIARRFVKHDARMAAVAKCNRGPVHQIPFLDRLARVVGGHPLTKFFHPTHTFVAKDDGKGHLSGFAGHNMNIAATNPSQDHANQGATGLGIENRNLPSFDLVLLDHYRRSTVFHDVSCSRLLYCAVRGFSRDMCFTTAGQAYER